jgi:transcription antitermination factor NusG
VLDVVSKGNVPTVVDDALLASLQSWAGDEVDLITIQPSLRVGDQVELVGGPLQGLSGTILKEHNGSARVTILLSFLQDGAHLTVDRSEVRLTA